MVYNRVRGLKTAYYWVLALVLAASYWLYLGLLIIVFHTVDNSNYSHYIIYLLIALVGLGVAALNSQKLNGKILRCDLAGS
jgi:hypothetical protein